MTAKKTPVVKPKIIKARAKLVTTKVVKNMRDVVSLKELQTFVETAITMYGESADVRDARFVDIMYNRPETEKERARRLKEEAAEKLRNEKRKAAQLKRDHQELAKLAKRLKMQVTPIQIHEPVKAPNYTE